MNNEMKEKVEKLKQLDAQRVKLLNEMRGQTFKVCDCCGRLLTFFRKKYCVMCREYIYEIKKSLSYYRKKSAKLTKEKYGQRKGSERLR